MKVLEMLTPPIKALVIVLFAHTALANTYWADANNGNDDYTGTAREWAGGATDAQGKEIGPRKSLKAAMALASSGDTVYALPGVYKDEVDAVGEIRARVCVKTGVKLISTDGRDKTFILGAPASTPDPETRSETEIKYGLGEDAVRCVYLDGTGCVFGFTLTDGHCKTVDNSYGYGGGVNAKYSTGYAVDCVISNCYGRRSGAMFSGGLVNSLVSRCATTGAGAGYYKGSAWNCVFFDSNTGTAAYICDAYNCTFDAYASGTGLESGKWMRCWNCAYLMANVSSYQLASNSCGVAVGSNSDWSDPANRHPLNRETELATDTTYMPVAGKNVGIDMANWDYYTNSFPAVAADYMYKDAYGKPRVVGDAMDVGAVECDWLAGFTADLTSSPYFAVTNFTAGVRERTAGASVAIPAGETLFARWDIPDRDVYAETYTLTAAVSGGATLKVVVNGEVKVALTGSKTVSYTFVGDQEIRFICEGEGGEAVLSTLATTAHLPYFVAPAPKGNDANDGLTIDTPKETLAAIAAIATERGAIIHAAPGVYDKGASGPFSTLLTTNRVIVAEGVGLLGDEGAEKTFIEGYRSPEAPASTNAIRCCYLRRDAWIRGFTLRNGAAVAVSTQGETGGALTCQSDGRGVAIECVFTNNVAVRGVSVSDTDLIRCRVYGNGVTKASYGDVYNGTAIVDSLFLSYGNAYTTGFVLNSTFVDGMLWAPNRLNWTNGTSRTYCAAFNSAICDNSMNRRFSNCTFVRTTIGTPESCEADPDCRFNVPYSPDGNGRPKTSDTYLIDRGSNDYYNAFFPAKWLQFKEMKDAAGGPRLRGAAIDIGSGEFDWSSTKVEGLVVSVTEGAEEGAWDMAISRDPDSARFCTGFTCDDEKVSFADHDLGWTWTRTVTGYPTTTAIVPLFEDIWYVNPVTGSDTEKCGKHPDLAFATITKAMSVVSQNGEIHCAAGTYSIANGNVGVYTYTNGTKYSYDLTNVVCFAKDYVTLVADEGPEKTIIEGVLSEGTEAVRGIQMLDHCVTRGFTVRNCSTWKNGEDDGWLYGGGIRAGTAVDCVVSNCWSGNRGGSSANATMVRCFIGLGCRSPRTSYGAGGHGGAYYGCVFLSETYTSGGTIVGCTYLGCAPRDSSGTVPVNVYNTFIADKSNGRCIYHNCKLTGSREKTLSPLDEARGNTEFNVAPSEYGYDPITYRPLAGSGLIDAGSNETFVAKFPEVYQDLDWAGGQRIYNGTIDIGAGEFDYRPAFAKELAKRRLVVDTATPTVELGEEDGLTMKDGDTLDLRWELILEGACSFKVTVTGDGAATVKVDGEVVQPDAAGVCAFAGTIGEHAVSIAFAGAGTATVDSFTCPKKGSVILVR